ncbi:copper homeostasis protein cutc [Colletotrichum truncatum]|uniref:Copper homeostasis protein cutc n=1 Tax=Colletotrichum truncatum TaxID=5467 RepID=A0ACC3ZHV4_COLTU|nr:copper homeostasis protein cutc [Colletotrichum truncatum]KAF6786712.1 copper homeostasis protein cutc [Colletotrichum truncatum]
MPIDLEIPVFSPSSALHAQALGAQRIELNAKGSYGVGGTTPTLDDLKGVTKWLYLPVRVMIRPRGKPEGSSDFIYSEDEFATMLRDVEAFREALRKDRGDGFVFGILKNSELDGHEVVDVERNRRLVEAAGGLPCSFHRAFDEVIRDGVRETVERGVRELVECGFAGVLTSGGPGNAADNKAVLEDIVSAAGPQKLEVIVGGGVRSTNVAKVTDGFGKGVWAHSSCFKGRGEEGELDDEEAMGILEVLSQR